MTCCVLWLAPFGAVADGEAGVPEPLAHLRRLGATGEAAFDYEYRLNFIGRDALGSLSWPKLADPKIRRVSAEGDRSQWMVGHWQVGGGQTAVEASSPADVLRQIAEGKDAARLAGERTFSHPGTTPFRMLYDGTLFVYHSPGVPQAVVNPASAAVHLAATKGPFCWHNDHFLWTATDRWQSLRPVERPSADENLRTFRWSGVLKFGAYEMPASWLVEFDRRRGWLPVRSQQLFFDREHHNAGAKLMALRESKELAEDRHVPVSWVEVMNATFDMTEEEVLQPSFVDPDDIVSEDCAVGEFVASRVETGTGGAALVTESPVRGVANGTEIVPIAPTGRLDLPGIKRNLAARGRSAKARPLNEPSPPAAASPAIDEEEARRYLGNAAGRPWWPYLTAAAVVAGVVLCIGVLRFRGGWPFAALLVSLTALAGCGGKPSEAVEARLLHPVHVVVQDDASLAEATLCLTNRRRSDLRIERVEASCSCSLIDDSIFPMTIEPGGTLRVPVRLSPSMEHIDRRYGLDLITPEGRIATSFRGSVVPDYELMLPEAGVRVVPAGSTVTISAVLREALVTDAPDRLPPVDVECQEDGEIVSVSQKTSPPDAAGLRFRDTTYMIAFKPAAGQSDGRFKVWLADRWGIPQRARNVVWAVSEG